MTNGKKGGFDVPPWTITPDKNQLIMDSLNPFCDKTEWILT